ncbi:MAG: DUF3846 domain-containing protein [Eubacteriales bacterium]|nr:DUF3846 domain-containing protein [Eubacteriales bacterium]
MNIRIYQINHERDTNRVKFESFENLSKYQNSPDVNPDIYDEVFQGEVDCRTLDDIYHKFNCDHPNNFKSHSLSVSDIIEIIESDKVVSQNGNQPSVESGFYFCDSVGFKKLDFVPPQHEKIRVVLVSPGKLAEIADINATLEGMQAVVGGLIEAVYPYEEQVAVVCNEEGKIEGLPLNRAIYNNDKEMVEIIAGNFFICDCSGENFGGLSDEQLKRYSEKFKNPERFYKIDGEIKAAPYDPNKNKNYER